MSRAQKRYRFWGALAGALIALAVANSSRAIFVSAPQIPRLPGDTTTTEILDGTITDIDVSTSAAIGATKIAPRGQIGSVLLSDGTYIATTTAVVVSTSTPVLSVIGGRISATSTSFNGVNMSWPSADGTSGQYLQTNGAGAYSYATAGLTMSFTAGQTLAANDPVSIETATNAAANLTQTTADNNLTFCDLTNTEWGQTFVPATSKLVGAINVQLQKIGSPTGNVVVAIVPMIGSGPDRANTIGSSTILNADITGSFSVIRANFFPAVYLSAGTKYALRIYGETCSPDAANNFGIQSSLTDTFATGDRALFSSGAWTYNSGRDMYFTIFDLGTTANRVYLATGAGTTSASTTIGFIQSAVSTSSTATVLGTGNVISGLRTMAVNATVMLGASPRTLMQTGSVISKALGIMISPTSMLVHIVPW